MDPVINQHIPTSEVLRGLLAEAPADWVSFGWLLDKLHKRSFGIVLLLLALIGLAPGTSPVVGLVLTIPAIQMILARESPAFPRIIASRRFSTRRLVRLVDRAVPVLRRMETVIHPRWNSVRSNDARGRACRSRADKCLLRAGSPEQRRSGRDDHADRPGLSRGGRGVAGLVPDGSRRRDPGRGFHHLAIGRGGPVHGVLSRESQRHRRGLPRWSGGK